MRLRTKLALAVTALIVLVVASIGALVVHAERRLLQTEMKDHRDQVADRFVQVCAESSFASDVAVFNYVRTLSQERGFLGAAFFDPYGVVVIHSDPRLIGTMNTVPASTQSAGSPPVLISQRDVNPDDVLIVARPVTRRKSKIGTAVLYLSKPVLNQFLADQSRQTVHRMLKIGIIALLVGILGALLLAQTFTRPIRAIVKGMRQVARGRFDPLPFRPRRDELGWIGDELNITIQKLAELENLKRDFAASVTHELRSPLGAIGLFVSLLSQGKFGAVSAQQCEALITIQNNTARLMRFIDDLLTTAKIEAKRVDVFYEELDIRESVGEVYRLFLPVAKEKNLRYELRLPEKPCRIWTDGEKIIQILTNLVSNACKFTSHGSVGLDLDEDETSVRVSVWDSGPGVPLAQREQIFEKFYQLKRDSRRPNGTGLGLSIVKGLLSVLGGEIHLTDNNGSGSRFTITLSKNRQIAA